MDPILKLVGYRLEACRFSRGSYGFEFSGQTDGIYRTLHVTTPYSACAAPQERDACSDISSDVWDMLEQTVTSIYPEQGTDAARISFEFENGRKLVIWADPPQEDNLLIVQVAGSEEWFPVL